MRAAIYARVLTFDREPENQLRELCGTSRRCRVHPSRGGVARGGHPALDKLVAERK